MAPVLRCQQLTKQFDKVRAVDALDLELGEGEVLALLGPNGAGKTTTIKMLVTLTKPTSGTAEVGGHDCATDPFAVRASLGYVSQDVALDRALSGREHLELHADLYHLQRKVAKERIAEVLALVELTDRADDPVRQYSGGMRKRLDIACGLVHRPRVLLLDEPTLGLDLQTRRRIWDAIRKLKAEGVSVLLTTHYLEEADQLADRVAIIDRGRIVAQGEPEELKRGLGGDGVQVKLGSAPQAGLLDDLRGMPGISTIAATSDGLTLVAARAEEAIPRIVQLAAKHGQPVEALSYARPSLDDVFLQATGRSLRDDEDGDTRALRALRRMRA